MLRVKTLQYRRAFFFTFAFVRRYIKNPAEGDKRTRRKFAWEKVIATDKDGRSAEIWLEWYIVTEEFHKHQEAVVEEWKVLERKLISKSK